VRQPLADDAVGLLGSVGDQDFAATFVAGAPHLS